VDCRWIRVLSINNAFAGLPAGFLHAFAACQGLSRDGGSQESYLPILLRELSLELVRLG
jgi:hypothetical protein